MAVGKPSVNYPTAACRHPQLCPLNEVRAGRAVLIRRLEGAPEVTQRLREMGLCEDRQVKMVSRQANVICQVCNVRLGISSEMAASIWVELLPQVKKAA